jgi:peptide/nickel transport system permease protein
MLTYILRRALIAIPLMLIATFILFCAVRITFDPAARLRASKDPQAYNRERHRLHLDEPLPKQYARWLGDFVRGDWGKGDVARDDVRSRIFRSLWNTTQLIVWGILISAAIAFIGVGPKEWLGIKPFYTLGLHSGDSTGYDLDYVRHLVLPVLVLTVQIIASWSRYMRASMLDAMGSEYIRTARAKGLPERRVVLRHALRNSLVPLISVMAIDIGALFGGLVITEYIFGIDGMGKLFIDRFTQGDATLLSAWVAVTAIFVIGFNLLADVLYGVLDPRVRLT